jgi:DNA-binding transcriptional LysR family regulator
MKMKKLSNHQLLSMETLYFIEAFERKSINKAARALGRDPGNISRSIAKLEDQIGHKLFNRHRDGLRANPVAESLYAGLKNAQKEINQSLDLNQETLKVIRIGFSATVAHSHFNQKWQEAISKNNFKPEFKIAPTVQLTEMLKSRELDLILIPQPMKWPGLIVKRISTEAIVLASLSGDTTQVLITNPDLLGRHRLTEGLDFSAQWLISDYFVSAKFLTQNENLMGMLPEGLLSNYPQLKIIKRYTDVGRITAVTWPGSVGTQLLAQKFWA